MNEEIMLECGCQILTLVGLIFGLVSLKIEIDSSNTEGVVLSCMMVVVFVVTFLTRLRIFHIESGVHRKNREVKIWKT